MRLESFDATALLRGAVQVHRLSLHMHPLDAVKRQAGSDQLKS